MRSIIKTSGVIALYFLFGTTPAVYGATLIDTGAPILDQSVGGPGARGAVLFDQQYLAGKIVLSQSVSITGIEAFMDDGGIGGTATIALYPNSILDPYGLPIPDTSIEQFSHVISVMDQNPMTTAPYYEWQGANGLNWNLAAGSYWVSFEVRPGQTLYGSMLLESATRVPNPLPDYAFWYPPNNGWLNAYDSWGVRVFGEVTSTSPVPLPASAWLLLSGLVTLAASVRKKARQTQP
jgi:hypothetical protein